MNPPFDLEAAVRSYLEGEPMMGSAFQTMVRKVRRLHRVDLLQALLRSKTPLRRSVVAELLQLPNQRKSAIRLTLSVLPVDRSRDFLEDFEALFPREWEFLKYLKRLLGIQLSPFQLLSGRHSPEERLTLLQRYRFFAGVGWDSDLIERLEGKENLGRLLALLRTEIRGFTLDPFFIRFPGAAGPLLRKFVCEPPPGRGRRNLRTILDHLTDQAALEVFMDKFERLTEGRGPLWKQATLATGWALSLRHLKKADEAQRQTLLKRYARLHRDFVPTILQQMATGPFPEDMLEWLSAMEESFSRPSFLEQARQLVLGGQASTRFAAWVVRHCRRETPETLVTLRERLAEVALRNPRWLEENKRLLPALGLHLETLKIASHILSQRMGVTQTPS